MMMMDLTRCMKADYTARKSPLNSADESPILTQSYIYSVCVCVCGVCVCVCGCVSACILSYSSCLMCRHEECVRVCVRVCVVCVCVCVVCGVCGVCVCVCVWACLCGL